MVARDPAAIDEPVAVILLLMMAFVEKNEAVLLPAMPWGAILVLLVLSIPRPHTATHRQDIVQLNRRALFLSVFQLVAELRATPLPGIDQTMLVHKKMLCIKLKDVAY